MVRKHDLNPSLQRQDELFQLILSRSELFTWLDTTQLLDFVTYAYENMDSAMRRQLPHLRDAYAMRDRLLEAYVILRYSEERRQPGNRFDLPLGAFLELLSAYAVQQGRWDYVAAGDFIDWELESDGWSASPEEPPAAFAEMAIRLGLWKLEVNKFPRFRFTHSALRDCFVFQAGTHTLKDTAAPFAALQEQPGTLQPDLETVLPLAAAFSKVDIIAALYVSGDPRIVAIYSAALFEGTHPDPAYIVKALERIGTPAARAVLRAWNNQQA